MKNLSPPTDLRIPSNIKQLCDAAQDEFVERACILAPGVPFTPEILDMAEQSAIVVEANVKGERF